MQTAIYYGIKHFGYIACYIAENRLYTMLYTMLYSISYILKTVLGLLNAIEPIFGYIAWYIACSTVLGTHVSELLGTRLGLLASICQSTARNQVMTRL